VVAPCSTSTSPICRAGTASSISAGLPGGLGRSAVLVVPDQRGELGEQARVSTSDSAPVCSIAARSSRTASTILSRTEARASLSRCARPEAAEQVLPDVGESLQAVEGEEAAGPLDRVDRAEDAGEKLPGAGVLLERQEVAVELIKISCDSTRNSATISSIASIVANPPRGRRAAR
jgi:hypothetical protein